MLKTNALLSCVLLAGACSVIGGCGDSSDTPEYAYRKGRVTRINTATGVVEMTTYSDRRKRDVPVSGKLAPDAEILINGATARLEDIQIDELVSVTGRIEKHDGDRQLVATKVEVTRPQAVGAATQPAEPPK